VVVAAVGLGAAVELLIGAAGGPLALLLVVGLLVAAGLVEQSSPEHPFVREAARLCGKAVRKRRWERYVWRDEGEAVAGSDGSLDPATTELLADIALLLNLMEHSERAEHLARLERSNAQPDLPRCMSESRKGVKLTRSCYDCEHKLCPYPDHLSGSSGVGPLSEAFCRHQSSHRSRGLPIRGRLHRSGVRRMSRRAARHFWDQMAERGRT
jgi:hypothetical protein